MPAYHHPIALRRDGARTSLSTVFTAPSVRPSARANGLGSHAATRQPAPRVLNDLSDRPVRLLNRLAREQPYNIVSDIGALE
jgi:hypothetical protein